METAQLTAVGVPADRHIQRPEVCGGIVFDPVRQQDQPRAGGKNRQSLPDPGLKRSEKFQFQEQFSDDCAFPAGKDECVKFFLQIIPLPDLHDLNMVLTQGKFMFGEIALQGQYGSSPDHLPRSSMMSLISSALIPTIASPRPLESSAIMAAS